MSYITHVELISGGTTWRIAASVKNSPGTVRSGIVINSTVGILSPGELDDGPVSRSYSDGSVWNPDATRAGKSISFPITFYSNNHGADWAAFESFWYSSANMVLKTYGDSPRTYNCQPQGLPADTTNGSITKCTAYFVSREAF